MATHYTQTKACRNLNLIDLASLSEEEAYDQFKRARWHESDGEPVCPRCGCFNPIVFRYRRIFRCRCCRTEFSVTSGTLLSHRKLPFRKLLFILAQFCASAKGKNSIELSQCVGCQPMSAFILAHKIREAMVSQTAGVILDNIVEVDGMYTGKYRRKTNYAENRTDFRKSDSKNQKVIAVARQRRGLTLTTVVKRETLSIPFIIERVDHNAIVHADEAMGWDILDQTFWLERVNHKEHYSHDGKCTNQAESFFSRVRRAEKGHYHRISGSNTDLYAGELAWRENHGRVNDADRYRRLLVSTMRHPVSRRFKGYWQRRASR